MMNTTDKTSKKNQFPLERLIRKNVATLEPYSSARDEFKADGQEMVFLDANENPFENGINRYPDPQQQELKEILAAQNNLKPSQLLLGNGSDEVLDLLFRAFCEPKEDNVITLPPTYGMYRVLARINNVEEREVLLTPEFEPDVPEILKKVDTNTKLIFLCSPNNPTGNSFAKESITEILENFEGLVVIDEAYIDFSKEKSWLMGLEQYPNLVITQTLSKAYGMAGIRLGICFASEEIVQVLNKIKPPYNVNSLTQERAMRRVNATGEVQNEIRELLEEREILEQELKKVDFIQKIYPSDANFLLVKVDNATKRYHQLLEKGVVIRNRTTQPLCENTLRFTIGNPEENLKLLKALNIINNTY